MLRRHSFLAAVAVVADVDDSGKSNFGYNLWQSLGKAFKVSGFVDGTSSFMP